MELAVENNGPSLKDESRELKIRLRRSQRRQKMKALLLVAPLFLFTLIVFITPIALMMVRSVESPEVQNAFPETSKALMQWQATELPSVDIYALMVQEIRQSWADKTLSQAAQRINYEDPGFRSLLTRTARQLSRGSAPKTAAEAKALLIKTNAQWGELPTWQVIKNTAPAYTSYYLLTSLDLQKNAQGDIVAAPEDQGIYVNIFLRTLWIAFVVTMICLVLGFPLAHLLANAPSKYANLLMIGVLLPFWTSLLVRTSAWVVVLQKNGLINGLLESIGLINEPLILLFNRPGVYIGLVHILLPFMVLSLYSVMKSIPGTYMRAALSLGAHPVVAFFKVYVPQTLPGVAAGFLLCFIMSIGYYITPALIGSPQDQMISYFIAYYTNNVINWGMASALGAILLLASTLLFVLYARLSNRNQIKMG
ncbi:putative spermidine/putrescine transport system permease protein [Oceanospirillum multiglobuliferum]|uniref:ABC transporter permease n=1 Tax=Oceanospirillum multiglobuliferum TaxID=64969 RepID=A0A1T4QAA2_9GAMM|nr:ABC transporter permease [Oceanospirillum multiglobuliferum]OPX56551.1 ABC transporter permease [Oceanospirillum multiglobuliferum]SKA00703.1 putative spermidine/putrescine transport system permease protein [Oceanospirillum multiglobuliferum]